VGGGLEGEGLVGGSLVGGGLVGGGTVGGVLMGGGLVGGGLVGGGMDGGRLVGGGLLVGHRPLGPRGKGRPLSRGLPRVEAPLLGAVQIALCRAKRRAEGRMHRGKVILLGAVQPALCGVGFRAVGSLVQVTPLGAVPPAGRRLGVVARHFAPQSTRFGDKTGKDKNTKQGRVQVRTGSCLR